MALVRGTPRSSESDNRRAKPNDFVDWSSDIVELTKIMAGREA
jgi:hypothetical protein